jgi:hypothetical protein
MADPEAQGSFPEGSQRAAFCHSRYRESKKNMADIKNVQIMRVGKWRGSREVDVTQDMLSEIARNFGTINAIEGFGVPVKLGHTSATGAMANGWATAVRLEGDALFADFDAVPSQIVDLVRARRYNAVSVELVPAITYAETKYTNVLSGVAFLGSEWPAIKGMKPLSAAAFAETVERLELTQEMDVMFTQVQLDAAVATAVTVLETRLTDAETRATTAEGKLALAEKAAIAITFGALVQAAIDKGVVLPKSKDTLLAFAATLPASIKVGDKTVTAVEAFTDFIAGLPAKVKLGEHGGSHPGAAEADASLSASDRVHTATLAYQAANKDTNYKTAFDAVLAADATLKTEYHQERM